VQLDARDVRDLVLGERMEHADLVDPVHELRPEVVNRIDEIVVFHPLGEAQIAEIAKIQLRALEARLAKMEIRLAVNDAALKVVAAAGFDPVYGARPLKRAIQQQIENPLAKEILAGRYAPGDTVKVGAGVGKTSGEITFQKG